MVPEPDRQNAGTSVADHLETTQDTDAILDAVIATAKNPQTPKRAEAWEELKAAAAKLEEIIQTRSPKRDEFNLQGIRGVNDINCTAQTIGSTIANYMKREQFGASRPRVEVFVKTCTST